MMGPHQGKRVPPAAWGAAAGAADGASWVRQIGRARDVRDGKRTAYPIQSGPTFRSPQKAEVLQPDEAHSTFRLGVPQPQQPPLPKSNRIQVL